MRIVLVGFLMEGKIRELMDASLGTTHSVIVFEIEAGSNSSNQVLQETPGGKVQTVSQ